MSRWADLFAKLLAAAQQGASKPVRPREVDDAITRDGLSPEEMEAYHRTHGGEAPPDAPHIPDDGTL